MRGILLYALGPWPRLWSNPLKEPKRASLVDFLAEHLGHQRKTEALRNLHGPLPTCQRNPARSRELKRTAPRSGALRLRIPAALVALIHALRLCWQFMTHGAIRLMTSATHSLARRV